MNEIILCTDKEDYVAGDNIFGAAYVKIESPTAGSGVLLKFFGYETYNFYPPGTGESIRIIQDTKEHVSDKNFILHQSSGPMSLGFSVYPFKLKLSERSPGSFTSYGENPLWKADIVYRIEVTLIGSEDILAFRNLLVHDSTVPVSTSLTEEISVKGILPFQTSTLTVNTNLDKEIYYVGDTVRLTVDFDKPKFRIPQIISLNVKLVHHVVLELRTSPHNQEDIFLDQSFQAPPSFLSLFHSSSKSTRNSQLMGNMVHVVGENLWETKMISDRNLKLINGVRNLLVPLKSNTDRILTPSTNGKHIFSNYFLEIDITLEEGATSKLTQPIPFVRHKPLKGILNREPVWARHCKLSMSAFCPESEAYNFDRMPVLQELLNDDTVEIS